MKQIRVAASPQDREAGISLPELLVTMFLMAIVATLVATLAASFSRTLTRERARNDSTNVAATGMNELTRVLRAGTTIQHDDTPPSNKDPMFVYAGNERITLNALVDTTAANPKPIRVSFLLDATRVLTETRTTARAGTGTEADWVFTGAGTSTSSRPIARTIVPRSGSEPFLFTYRDSNGDLLTPAAGASLSAADMARIATIEVYLRVQADPTDRADPVTLTNRVGLLNVGS